MIAAFLHWWFEQLRSLIPARWRESDGIAADHLVMVPAASGCSVLLHRADGEQPVGSFLCDENGARALRSAAPEACPRVGIVRIPASQILTKTLSLPLAARRNVAQVLEFEIDHETPFRSADVLWRHEIRSIDRARERIDVTLQLVPRAVLAGATKLAEAADVQLSAIEFVPDDGRPRRIALGQSSAPVTTRRLHLAHAAVLAALAVAAVAVPFLRVSHALSVVRADIEQMSAVAREAVALKSQIADLSRARRLTEEERRRVRDPLRVLAAATAALPDGTYLTELSLRGEQATLVGMSPSAAGLIPSLAATAPFHDPAFASAVTRPEGRDLELFTIRARIAPTDPTP